MAAGCVLPQEFRVNGIQPRNAVLVVQWNAAMHLCFVPWRVKIVGFQKHPAQTRSERTCDGGFARACHSHYQKDHRGSERVGARRVWRKSWLEVQRIEGQRIRTK